MCTSLGSVFLPDPADPGSACRLSLQERITASVTAVDLSLVFLAFCFACTDCVSTNLGHTDLCIYLGHIAWPEGS